MSDSKQFDWTDFSAFVVEDEAVSQAALVTLLTNVGFGETRTADNGADALDRLDLTGGTAGFSPDVMFVDIGMPVMSGPDMLRKLAEYDYEGIIILVSGLDPETLEIAEQMATMRGVHVAGVIHKPVTKSALADMLADLDFD